MRNYYDENGIQQYQIFKENDQYYIIVLEYNMTYPITVEIKREIDKQYKYIENNFNTPVNIAKNKKSKYQLDEILEDKPNTNNEIDNLLSNIYLNSILDNFNNIDKEIIIKRYLNNMDVKTISKQLKIKEYTIRYRLKKIRKELVNTLKLS